MEHKLELRSYFDSESGGILVAAMGQRTGRTGQQLRALLDQVRPLEFYMPVPEHRETWIGSDQLLVASLLEDYSAPIGYTLTGEPVLLDPGTAPTLPTLALVPVETDLSQPLSPEMFVNETDQRGAAIGTYKILPPCDPELGCSGGGGGSPPGGQIPAHAPGGLYMTYSNVFDDGEHWLKGAPEIEVHILGPRPWDSPGDARTRTCAGDRRSGHRFFNQDTNTWSGYVLLLTDAEIREHGFHDGRQFTVQLWEDDHTMCEIVHDPNAIRNHLFWLVAGANAVRLGYQCDNPEVIRPSQCPWAFYAGAWLVFQSTIDLIRTNDDYLGTAVPRATVANFSDPLATHALIKAPQDTRNGGIRIVNHIGP